ncbi:unnamed protein product [Toxocara canis]|uniref:E3 ubiquitin-protein ligase RFWD3-like WD40 domain-containing protein n=1 Tax=Toxocara canis TaxID=6265 RepID=A0A3P7GQN1_TOXCA|nr:unnamed protein product [Toxocara canis]
MPCFSLRLQVRAQYRRGQNALRYRVLFPFGEPKRLLHQLELSASGWSCCWLSANEVVVGLVNGRVLKFDVREPTATPIDLTGGTGRRPILYVQALRSIHAVMVVSVWDCVLYHHQKQYTLISNAGSISSFCYELESDSFLVSFGPCERHTTARHMLYRLMIADSNIVADCIRVYNSRSTKQTRLISCALWNTSTGQISAVFDEANSQLVILDWTRQQMEVMFRRIEDEVVAVKEIRTDDPCRFRVVCISETKAHFFDLRC